MESTAARVSSNLFKDRRTMSTAGDITGISFLAARHTPARRFPTAFLML
jgi:hypothetical protein